MKLFQSMKIMFINHFFTKKVCELLIEIYFYTTVQVNFLAMR